MASEIIVQCGGWPRQWLAWIAAEAGAAPPARDWRHSSLEGAVRSALEGLGIERATTVIEVAPPDEADLPEQQLGSYSLAHGWEDGVQE